MEWLKKHRGYIHLSARSLLTELLLERGEAVNRDTMTTLANNLRVDEGPSALVSRMLRIAFSTTEENRQLQQPNTIIESIRTVAEAQLLRQQTGARLLCVDAPVDTRYSRIVRRKSATDVGVSFECFQAQEEREMSNSDPSKQNLRAVMDLADVRIDNSGTLEELHEALSVAFPSTSAPPPPEPPPRLIVATCEALLHELSLGRICLKRLRTLAIDEVDAILCSPSSPSRNRCSNDVEPEPELKPEIPEILSWLRKESGDGENTSAFCH